jgi:hypothetical protein
MRWSAMRRAPPHRNIALAIFAAGWLAGLPILMFGAGDDAALPFELTMDAKVNLGRLERLGGRSALFYEQLGETLGAFFHGWRLGLTIGVLGSLLALAWYLLAPDARGA